MKTAKILRFDAPNQSDGYFARWYESDLAVFVYILSAEILLHISLLTLPYFWDEAGYYIPAARDLLLTGSLIPTSTLTNAHPPFVMGWIAMWWKVAGFHPLVTRLAMLVVATLACFAVFRLGCRVANRQVALMTALCTGLYPVFFAQSSLAHLDMAAAAFTMLGLTCYLRDRMLSMALLFAIAALCKETAIIAPLALIFWELIAFIWRAATGNSKFWLREPSVCRIVWLAIPLLPLAGWFAWHYHCTGFIFGNPQFLEYNLGSTLHPARFFAALAIRTWQLLGYMNMFVLVVATGIAMTRPPLKFASIPGAPSTNGGGANERRRISVPAQLVFYVLIFAYAVALSVVGGAVLARYLLPVYPLIILVAVSTIWRRIPWWPAFLAVVCAAFVVALVTDPPYRAAPEDNLGYAKYVRVHQQAAQVIEAKFPSGLVVTAWPASDELTKPYLGYVSKPINVIRIENFSPEQILALRDTPANYHAALVFSTKYEPISGYIIRLTRWDRMLARYFNYYRDLPPGVVAEMLNGRVFWQQRIGNEWAAVLAFDVPVNAQNTSGTMLVTSRR
ncbi:MAG TPA: glycosyltransferase family 39 protein [Terriglobales bacterium]|nr:glycosyltransferase family 39 protein [Terriglobales bacterium]